MNRTLFDPVQRHRDVQPLDRDKLSMTPRLKAAQAAQAALFGVQDLPPEEAMLGVSLLMATLCERTGTDPETLFHMGRNVLKDREFETKANDALQSLRDFAGLRFMGQEVVVL